MMIWQLSRWHSSRLLEALRDLRRKRSAYTRGAVGGSNGNPPCSLGSKKFDPALTMSLSERSSTEGKGHAR